MSTIQDSLLDSLGSKQQSSIKAMIDSFYHSFRAKTRPLRLFRVFIFFLALTETTIGFYVFSHGSPFALAAFVTLSFFTLFSYFIASTYFKTRLIEENTALIEYWVNLCLQTNESEPDSFIFFLKASDELFKELKITQIETIFYSHELGNLVTKFRVWLEWKSYLKIKHLLLKRIIQQHLESIHLYPLEQNYHDSLAEYYLMLADLYHDFSQVTGIPTSWSPRAYQLDKIEYYSRKSLARALETYQILNDLNDGKNIRILKCMAVLHHKLHQKENELSVYEQLFQLQPDDQDVLYALAKLYFEVGKRARGLQIYLMLSACDPKRSKNLIMHFGADEIQDEDLI